jgi:hypothetical protein
MLSKVTKKIVVEQKKRVQHQMELNGAAIRQSLIGTVQIAPNDDSQLFYPKMLFGHIGKN